MKKVAPYFPNVSKAKDIGETKPHTPPGLSGYPTSISEFPAPRKNRTLKFEEADVTRIIPIASITSQGRLATLLSDELEGNYFRKVNMDRNKEAEDSTDPFSGKHTPRGPKENVPESPKSSRVPPGPPSDSSDSDTDSEPRKLPKIPPRSSKRPSTIVGNTEIKMKHYHFDLKLKPESVPQRDGNPDV